MSQIATAGSWKRSRSVAGRMRVSGCDGARRNADPSLWGRQRAAETPLINGRCPMTSREAATGIGRETPPAAAISERVVSRYPAERAAIRRPAGPARVADGSDEQDADGGESERLERIIPAEWPAGDAVQSATCASRRSDSGIRTDQPPAGRE